MKIRLIILPFIVLITTGCIKQKDLYQGEDDKKEYEEDNKPGYLYPFNLERQNATAEITIKTNEDMGIERIHANIPSLKYNKNWLLMFTQDDSKHSAFCRTWAAINGRPISSSEIYDSHDLYYDIAHLRRNDLPPTIISAQKTLGCTDGTGNEVRFAITTTLCPEKEWMNSRTDVKPGFTKNYYRFYMKSGLIWNNVIEMLNFDTGIAFHDVEAPNVYNSSQIVEHYKIAQDSILKRLSGRGCKMLAEPNGNKTYVTAALQYPTIQTMTAQAGTVKLFPFKVEDDLQNILIHREFNDATAVFREKITNELRLSKTERAAVYIGAHNTDNPWIDLLTWVNDTYGKDGDDSVWFPSQEEYYEYNYYRVHGTTSVEQIDDRTLKLTVTLPSGEYFYYPSITVNVKGISKEQIASISSNDQVTSLSYGNYEDGVMFNIDCRRFLVEHATHYVEEYEKDKTCNYAKADALYFVNKLKDSAKKKELLSRIE